MDLLVVSKRDRVVGLAFLRVVESVIGLVSASWTHSLEQTMGLQPRAFVGVQYTMYLCRKSIRDDIQLKRRILPLCGDLRVAGCQDVTSRDEHPPEMPRGHFAFLRSAASMLNPVGIGGHQTRERRPTRLTGCLRLGGGESASSLKRLRAEQGLMDLLRGGRFYVRSVLPNVVGTMSS